MAYTDKQKAEAAALLAEGRSYRDVEEETGIPRSTVHDWRANDRTFSDAIAAGRASLEDLAAAVVGQAWGELLRRLRDDKQRTEITADALARMGALAATQLVALRRIETPTKVEHSGPGAGLTPDELLASRLNLRDRLAELPAREAPERTH